MILAQPVTSNYGCVDNGSQLANCAGPVASGVSIDTATVGAKAFTVNAADLVGNPSSSAAAYTVSFGLEPLGTNKNVSLRLVDFGGTNRSSAAITLTIRSIDGVLVSEQAFTFMGGNYRYTPPATLAGKNHTLVFVATGDPVAHTVPFTM